MIFTSFVQLKKYKKNSSIFIFPTLQGIFYLRSHQNDFRFFFGRDSTKNARNRDLGVHELLKCVILTRFHNTKRLQLDIHRVITRGVTQFSRSLAVIWLSPHGPSARKALVCTEGPVGSHIVQSSIFRFSWPLLPNLCFSCW